VVATVAKQSSGAGTWPTRPASPLRSQRSASSEPKSDRGTSSARSVRASGAAV